MLKIDSLLLKQVFGYLSPSLSTKSKNPYSKAILIKGENGKIEFRANNSLVESTVNLLHEVEENFVVCVDQFIQDIISQLSGEVEFSVNLSFDKEKNAYEELTIHVDNNDFKFGTLDPEKFPNKIPNEDIETKIVEDKEKFFLNFAVSSFCTSDNPTVQIYKSFNLGNKTIATTNEVMGVLLKENMGESNPPAKELNSILSAIKGVEDEDEIFYLFDEKICTIKVSEKNLDVEYMFSPIDGKFPVDFFKMVEKYTGTQPDLIFTILRENLNTIINTANIFATKASQEGFPTYLTMTYNKNVVNFLMEIPSVSQFNIQTPIENLEAQVNKFTIYFDPIDFKKFLELGGDVTIKFFKGEPVFICTTSQYDNLIYFQTTVRKRKQDE